MPYPAYLVFIVVISTISIFWYLVKIFLGWPSDPKPDKIEKIFTTIVSDDLSSGYPYVFRPMQSKNPKDLLRECEENNLQPAPTEELDLFVSHYQIIIQGQVVPNYYNEYNCWGIEISKGVIALIMKRV